MPETVVQKGFRIRPFTLHCQVIHKACEHAVIGVSPGNSYFSAERIHDLAEWGLAHFERVDFIYTDLFQAEMFEALGDSEHDARRKASKRLRNARSRIAAAVTEFDPMGKRLSVHPISELVQDNAYRLMHADLLARLAADEEFSKICHEQVVEFLSSKVPAGAELTPRQREVCFDYICAEIPILLDTPAILDVPSSLFCYHRLLPLAETLYGKGAGLRASRNQGHAIVTALDVP